MACLHIVQQGLTMPSTPNSVTAVQVADNSYNACHAAMLRVCSPVPEEAAGTFTYMPCKLGDEGRVALTNHWQLPTCNLTPLLPSRMPFLIPPSYLFWSWPLSGPTQAVLAAFTMLLCSLVLSVQSLCSLFAAHTARSHKIKGMVSQHVISAWVTCHVMCLHQHLQCLCRPHNMVPEWRVNPGHLPHKPPDRTKFSVPDLSSTTMLAVLRREQLLLRCKILISRCAVHAAEQDRRAFFWRLDQVCFLFTLFPDMQ